MGMVLVWGRFEGEWNSVLVQVRMWVEHPPERTSSSVWSGPTGISWSVLIEEEALKTDNVLELEPFCRVTRRVSQSSTAVALIVEMFSTHSTVGTTKLPDRLRRLLGQETNVVEGTSSHNRSSQKGGTGRPSAHPGPGGDGGDFSRRRLGYEEPDAGQA